MVKLAMYLDEVAEEVQPRNRRLAFRIDRLSDYLDGLVKRAMHEERQRRQARRQPARRSDVLQRDADEYYMERFNETGAYEWDADEPYMERFSNPDEFPGVRERVETAPRDLAPGAEVRQQPSQRHFMARRRRTSRRPSKQGR